MDCIVPPIIFVHTIKTKKMKIWVDEFKKQTEIVRGGYSMGFVRPAKRFTWEEAQGIVEIGQRLISFIIKRRIGEKSEFECRMDKINFPKSFKKKRVHRFESVEQMINYVIENNYFNI